MVEVMLNDSHAARFLVDTGAGFTVISPGLAVALGIAPGPDAPRLAFGTLAGRGTAPVVMLRSLRVGDTLEEKVAAAVHQTGPDMEGILGNDILARYAVTVDPTRRVLEIRPP
jgi:predicted aspartyl protease